MDYTAQQESLARAAIRGRRAQVPKPGEPPPSEPIRTAINVAAIGTATLIGGIAGRRISVYEVLVWSVGAQDLQFFNGADTIAGPINSFPAASGLYLPTSGEPHWRLDPGRDLLMTTSAADQVSGYLLYRMET